MTSGCVRERLRQLRGGIPGHVCGPAHSRSLRMVLCCSRLSVLLLASHRYPSHHALLSAVRRMDLLANMIAAWLLGSFPPLVASLHRLAAHFSGLFVAVY